MKLKYHVYSEGKLFAAVHVENAEQAVVLHAPNGRPVRCGMHGYCSARRKCFWAVEQG